MHHRMREERGGRDDFGEHAARQFLERALVVVIVHGGDQGLVEWIAVVVLRYGIVYNRFADTLEVELHGMIR